MDYDTYRGKRRGRRARRGGCLGGLLRAVLKLAALALALLILAAGALYALPVALMNVEPVSYTHLRLPDARGRQWYECDVNYAGGHRGAERLLFSSDGLIYYTGDHYESYAQIYDGGYWPDGEYREDRS